MVVRRNRAKMRALTLSLSAVLAVTAVPYGAYAADSSGGMEAAEGSSSGTDSGSGMGVTAQREGFPEPQVEVGLDPADAKITKEEAVDLVRGLFPVLKQAELDAVEFGNPNAYPPQQEIIWSIRWTYHHGNSSSGFSTDVDALTGDLVSAHLYFYHDAENQAYYPSEVDEVQAKERAKAFIGKAVSSSEASEWVFAENADYGYDAPLFGPVRYSFQYKREVNGLPSNAETVQIELNGSGQVTSFYKRAGSFAYPSSTPAIDPAAAREAYADALDLELAYIPERKSNREIGWQLVWRPTANLWMLDASSANATFIDYDGKPVRGEQAYEALPAAADPFVPRSDGELLTAKQAEALIRDAFEVPEGRELSTQRLETDYYYTRTDKNPVWELRWRDAEARPFGFPSETYAVVDAATGQIYEFQKEHHFGEEPTEVPETERIEVRAAKEAAFELVASLYPNAARDLKHLVDEYVIQDGITKGDYSFRFPRFYEGRPIDGAHAYVSMKADGTVTSYGTGNALDAEASLADLKPAITEEQAKKQWLDASKQVLSYGRINVRKSGDDVPAPQVKLIYQTEFENRFQGHAVHAVTGKWVRGWSGDRETEPVPEPTDLEGHWARKPIETLVRYGVLTPAEDGQVRPNAEVTVLEWFQMLAAAHEPYYAERQYYDENRKRLFADVKEGDEAFPAILWAVEREILESDPNREMESERKLTRAELATLLVDYLRYDKLSEHLNDSDWVDRSIPAESRGAVLVATGLGLMGASGGEFHPERVVTRAEAASVLMRLVYLQGQTDHR